MKKLISVAIVAGAFLVPAAAVADHAPTGGTGVGALGRNPVVRVLVGILPVLAVVAIWWVVTASLVMVARNS